MSSMATAANADKLPFQLFKRAGSARWWMRFSIRGQGQIRVGLGTDDEAEALKLAQQHWFEANYRAKQGISAVGKTFAQVAEEFIEQIEREADRGERHADQKQRFPAIIRRYFIPYFGSKPIDSIGDKDVTRYLEWRKSYWTTGPGKDVQHIEYQRGGKTLRRPVSDMRRLASLSSQRSEAVVLRQLLRQAARWGHITQNAIPEVNAPKVPPSPRPSFDMEEFQRLQRVSLERLSDEKVNGHVRRDRTILHAYITIAAFTGMRPTELKNLNWGDIRGYREGRKKPIGQRDIRIRARGKGKHREFIPHEHALPWFDILWTLWLGAMETEPKDDDPIFATLTGKRLGTVRKGLSELLKAADLLTDHRGKRRESYSFRHFHISQQIMNGVDVFVLAKNTGTSPKMIDDFYGQVKLELMKDHLRPEWRSR
jgi:integrase